jgi:DNA-binding NarL/FixJ family response regulator
MARREDRWLGERGSGKPSWRQPHERTPSLAVVAQTPADAESLKELLATPNETEIRQYVGQPDMNDPASVLVWDVGDIGPRELQRLRLLSASRPSRRIVLLLSFPRGDVAHAARQAGAASVLGRPVDRDVLWGTILRLESGLSAPHTIR